MPGQDSAINPTNLDRRYQIELFEAVVGAVHGNTVACSADTELTPI
ncbi:hypothetical protein [Nocardia gipuzkoensis]